MPKKPPGYERMREVISYRITDSQRAFLEGVAKERGVGICEAGRIALDAAIAQDRARVKA